MPVVFFWFFNIWTVQVLCIHVSTLPSLLEQTCCFKLYAYIYIYLKIAFIIIVTNTLFQVVCIYIYIHLKIAFIIIVTNTLYVFSFNPHTCWFVRCNWHSCVLCLATPLPGTLFIPLFRDSCRLVGQADLLHHTQSGWFITSHTIRLIFFFYITHNQANLLHHTQSGFFFFFFFYITPNQANLLHQTHNQACFCFVFLHHTQSGLFITSQTQSGWLLHLTQSGWFITITHKDSFSWQCAVFQVSHTNGLSVNILLLIECLLICFSCFVLQKVLEFGPKSVVEMEQDWCCDGV